MKFLLDENTHGGIPKAIRKWNVTNSPAFLDVLRVGDSDAPPYTTPDDEILLWAMRENRIVLTRDFETMPGHLKNHLDAGHSSPGVLFLSPKITIAQVVLELVRILQANRPEQYADCITWIPL
jgi:hypothetical protein